MEDGIFRQVDCACRGGTVGKRLKKAVFTYVPGKGATEYYAAAGGQAAHFYHEELAYSVAHGASLAGAPGFAFLKSHGVAKAMNAVIASLYAGTGAPLLAFAFDDAAGGSSDHPFASFAMLEGAGARVIRAQKRNVLESVRLAFEESLVIKKPVFLTIEVNEMAEEELAALKGVVEELVAQGQSRFKAAERYQALLNPLLSARFTHALSRIPRCPQDLPPHLKQWAERYEPVIAVLETLGHKWVTGDAGTSSLFGLPPHDFIDVCTHMGGAVPLAMGAALAGVERVLAVSGDFSFISTGNLALTEALRRGIGMDVVIFRNGEAAATGGQAVARDDVLNQIPDGVASTEVDSNEDGFGEKIRDVLAGEAKGGPRVLIAAF